MGDAKGGAAGSLGWRYGQHGAPNPPAPHCRRVALVARLVPVVPKPCGSTPQAVKAEAGTGMGALGTNVATEIWGQVSVLKFKKTC